ncbi:hypothetical protein AAG570_004453 [Ranatra chinensis]|uniref:Uncharacterized protein n=1 Tax=Ranatra chinensis TaxID=642074 RepID=A0ABD0YPH0_9HEMI
MFREAVSKFLAEKAEKSPGVPYVVNQKEEEDVQTAMDMFPYFKTWSRQVRRECSIYSTVKTYPPKASIEVKDDNDADVSFFVLHGSCTAVRMLTVDRVFKKNKKPKYRLCELHTTRENETDGAKRTAEDVFMQVCRLLPGSCFGLGEVLAEKCSFMAGSHGARCLVMPRDTLLKNEPSDHVWKRIVHFTDLSTPTDDRLLAALERNRDGRLARKDSKNNRHMTVHDVPMSCRIGRVQVPQKVKAIRLQNSRHIALQLNELHDNKAEWKNKVLNDIKRKRKKIKATSALRSLLQSGGISAESRLEEILRKYFAVEKSEEDDDNIDLSEYKAENTADEVNGKEFELEREEAEVIECATSGEESCADYLDANEIDSTMDEELEAAEVDVGPDDLSSAEETTDEVSNL